MWLQVINKVKVTHQGEGHIKVKVKYLHPFKFYVAHALCKRVVCIRLKCYLLFLQLDRWYRTRPERLCYQGRDLEGPSGNARLLFHGF